jgi:cytochrome c-type biogenesis protein CcmH
MENHLRSSRRRRTSHRVVGRLVIVFVATITTSVARDSSARFEFLSHRIYCNCGCGEILAECAHPGCRAKLSLSQELRQAALKNLNDRVVLDGIAAKYGPTVLASPPFRGLNIMLWIMPIVLSGVAVLGLLRFWLTPRSSPGGSE